MEERVLLLASVLAVDVLFLETSTTLSNILHNLKELTFWALDAPLLKSRRDRNAEDKWLKHNQ